MKFALLTVTYGGLFYKGAALTLGQQITKAKQLGFDGLAIETKRPVASPLDLRKDDRQRIKNLRPMRALNCVRLKACQISRAGTWKKERTTLR